MVKLNGWKETIFSVLILGENFLLIGLSNVKMVFFLSGINLSIFFLLNPAIYRISNTPNTLCHRNKMNLTPILIFIARFPKLL